MKESNSFVFLDEGTDFTGTIETSRLVLAGSVKGDIHAREQVFLKNGARVKGDISTKRFLLEEGSVHKGELEMDTRTPSIAKPAPAEPKAAPKPAPAPAASSKEANRPEPSLSDRLW